MQHNKVRYYCPKTAKYVLSHMVELWIPVTIAAAFFQNLRSALQKNLKGRLSTVGAAYSRFLYALPVIAVYLWVLHQHYDFPLPEANPKFFLFCTLGGICQIIFTVMLMWMFSFQSFAVGTAFSKLEVIMVAVLGALIIGDSVSAVAVLAFLISTLGIFSLSLGQNNISFSALIGGIYQKSTLIGLVCAAWLGSATVFYRGAALSLEHDQIFMAAAFTLMITLTIQTVIMGLYLLIREPGQFTKMIKNWRWAGAAGFAGAVASICWFTAFTVQNGSYVRAVGQIELVFTFIATTVFFREKVSTAEIVGIVMISGGIIILVLYG